MPADNLPRYNNCSLKVNFFGPTGASSNYPQRIFWDSFNGNSSTLQRLVFALIPKDFDTTSNSINLSSIVTLSPPISKKKFIVHTSEVFRIDNQLEEIFRIDHFC